MPIEILNDIVEELADKLGIYGAETRNEWVVELERRIRFAVANESCGQVKLPKVK